MKNLILIILLISGYAVQAQEKEKEKQSLKDLLYSGKLKKDSSGIIRKTDDLSKKIDTSSKKDTPTVKPNTPAVSNVQQDKNAVISKIDTASTRTVISADSVRGFVDSSGNVAVPTVSAKSNTKLWKDYTDSLTKTLQDEVLKSKQIKKDSYFILIDYEIGTDGQVTFTNVTSTPENAFLQGQIRQIIDSSPLRMNPVTDSSNQPKKVKRRGQFSVTKD